MNGENVNFERAIQALLIALVTAGVAGLWTMTASVARLEERMDNYLEVQRDTNQTVTRRLDQVDERLRLIERNVNRYPPEP